MPILTPTAFLPGVARAAGSVVSEGFIVAVDATVAIPDLDKVAVALDVLISSELVVVVSITDTMLLVVAVVW